ncbi:hypothetical protein [Umezawaea beigongshangensis]|uniref:hypothetical protein n=1 Tax=Umezawaea beigongshangensis TaxID=2780383 RepID=UPI0018F1D6D8|nr:hypothetical protein [Umezawaea beigongshangensis]
MEWFTAISGLLVDLAWPIVALTAIVLFRRPLGEVIGRVRSVEVPGGAITFGDELEQVERQLQDASERLAELPFGRGHEQPWDLQPDPPSQAGTHGSVPPPTFGEPGYGGEPADRSPPAARGTGGDRSAVDPDPVGTVVRSWSAVEEKVVDLYGAVTGDPSRQFYGDVVLMRLAGVLPVELAGAIRSLRRSRDLAVRGSGEVSAGEAVAYASSADTAIEMLEAVARTSGRSGRP